MTLYKIYGRFVKMSCFKDFLKLSKNSVENFLEYDLEKKILKSFQQKNLRKIFFPLWDFLSEEFALLGLEKASPILKPLTPFPLPKSVKGHCLNPLPPPSSQSTYDL